MQKINFPKRWLLNLNSVESLAKKLNLSAEYLQSLEKRIPSCYVDAKVKTKNKIRPIVVPSPELKTVQRKILSNVLKFQFPNYVHGGVPGRSIISNAETHLSKKWVMCLDISNFFPSVYFQRICDNFISLKCCKEVASILTHFTTYKYQLPQGAPTSPMIANIILYSLDNRFFNLCRQHGFKYSRYFDDITISGDKNPAVILNKCKSIIEQEGFKMSKKPGKLRILPSSENQIVTGLLVNGKKLQITPDRITEVKNIIKKVSSGDFSIFAGKDPIKIKSTIRGHLAFLESVDPVKTGKLKTQFSIIDWDSL